MSKSGETPECGRAARSKDDAGLPLHGVHVLDFGHTVMGPTCGMVLADLGADVTRIEPVDGDRTRRLGGFGAGFFAAFNRNKSSIGIDLKKAEGRQVAERLIQASDVLIENFAPGTMRRLGLDWPRAKTLNQRLIYCALKGYLPGPYEDLPALDEVVQMQSGMAYMTGPRGMPLRAGASVVDILGGVFGAVAILAALRERENSGKGQLVQSSLFESAAFLMSQHLAVAAASQEPVVPMPEKKVAWAIYDVFQSADLPVFIGVTSDRHWERFRTDFDLGRWAFDPKYATQDGRLEGQADLKANVSAAIEKFSAAEVLLRCRNAKVPCAPVNVPESLLDDEHLAATDAMHSIEIVNSITTKIPALPIEMQERRLPLRNQPPAIGEGATARLHRAGFALQEIEALAAARVLSVEAS